MNAPTSFCIFCLSVSVFGLLWLVHRLHKRVLRLEDGEVGAWLDHCADRRPDGAISKVEKGAPP